MAACCLHHLYRFGHHFQPDVVTQQNSDFQHFDPPAN
jgi:hypothetical protein